MTSNYTDACYTETDGILVKYYLPVMYSIIFIFGSVGNGVVLLGYLFCLKNWKSGNILLFNLSISDLSFLCTLPALTNHYTHNDQELNKYVCIINRFLLHSSLYTSILFLTIISIDRYMLIRYPFRQHILQRKTSAIIVCIVIWTAVTLELVPMFTFIIVPEANKTECLDYASSGDAHSNLIYSLCLTLAGFIIPSSVMIFFYYKTAALLKHLQKENINTVKIEKPLSLLTLAIGILIVLFTPYHIMRNLFIVSRLETFKMPSCTSIAIKSMYIITRPVAFSNSAINPVLYFLMGDQFRELMLTKIRNAYRRMTAQHIEDSSGNGWGIGSAGT
ncbi:succinate receptor 1-like [Protopterus annectens]|uniref:succinate receptor 1-like n=1 Tax=Protopterus annectens TaxID=7888 RepID=UPI001CFAD198|nr:succinate receptor 1-like [Protopterus annectens]